MLIGELARQDQVDDQRRQLRFDFERAASYDSSSSSSFSIEFGSNHSSATRRQYTRILEPLKCNIHRLDVVEKKKTLGDDDSSSSSHPNVAPPPKSL